MYVRRKYGLLVLPPKSLRQHLLQELHHHHSGEMFHFLRDPKDSGEMLHFLRDPKA